MRRTEVTGTFRKYVIILYYTLYEKKKSQKDSDLNAKRQNYKIDEIGKYLYILSL